jgi:hypothetical protein
VKYIVEARHELHPPLFATGEKGMFEVDKSKAMRFSQEKAREIAAAEKRLRPGRRLLIIKVAS